MQNCTVFYSWQSDLPNPTNRSLIQKALENVARSIREDKSITVEPRIDRDTEGKPGSPDIADVIFEKIASCDIFACDVSIIGKTRNRYTPNPNVLIELGYAMKSLGPERIIMIMNTAFGEPERLPFDLNKKRVLRYRIEEGADAKAAERRELEKTVDKAIRAILRHLDEMESKAEEDTEPLTLKEKCKQVILDGNLQQWRRLTDEIWSPIPSRILEWKPRAEKSWGKADSAQRKALRFEAVEICMTCIVPIFVALQNGRKDFWKEAARSLQQLALLEKRIGAGFTDIIEIGSHTLYFAGSLGMSIAAETRQLDFVDAWMRLPMPHKQLGDTTEKPWAQMPHAHRLWGHYFPPNPEPLHCPLKVSQSEGLTGFFPDKKRLEKYLFLANLAQSLFELGRRMENADCRKSLEETYTNRFARRIELDVWPIWTLMKPDDFRTSTWGLFESSENILRFVLQDSVPPETFWRSWKTWKQLCVDNIMRGEMQRTAPQMIRANFLMLPGEPQIMD